MKIRELQPGAAWSDAERRSIPVGILGFFLTGLLSSFGFVRAVPHPFTAGVLGSVAFFLAMIALFLGYYHRKTLLGVSVASLCFMLPWLVGILVFRITAMAGIYRFIPLAATGTAIYLGLHRMHFTLCKTTAQDYLAQLAYEQHGDPKTNWEAAAYIVCLVVGTAVLLLLVRIQ